MGDERFTDASFTVPVPSLPDTTVVFLFDHRSAPALPLCETPDQPSSNAYTRYEVRNLSPDSRVVSTL
jgi:hypothetical protein